MNAGAAQAWFIAGAIMAMLGGGGHGLLALVDTVRANYFVPNDGSLKPGMEATGMRLVRMLGGGDASPSMWRIWLGINIGIGIGVFSFGLLCLLIAAYDFELVERIYAIRPLTIAFSASLLAVSLRFWFYGPTFLTGTATLCFTVATVLSA
jgi:hypothetical protein